MSPTVGYALIPSTAVRLGFTGYTVPPNGLFKRFHNTVRPTEFAFSVAPITATDLGANSGSKLFCEVVTRLVAFSLTICPAMKYSIHLRLPPGKNRVPIALSAPIGTKNQLPQ